MPIKIQPDEQYADIYLLQSHSTCLGVTAPIIKSTKNSNRRLRRLQLQFLILLMMGAVTPKTCRVTLQ